MKEFFHIFALLVVVVASIIVNPFEGFFNGIEEVVGGIGLFGCFCAAFEIGGACVGVDGLVKTVTLIAPKTCGNPTIAFDIGLVTDNAFTSAFWEGFAVDDGAVLNNFNTVNGVERCESGFDVEGTAAVEIYGAAHLLIVDGEVDGWAVGNEGVAGFHAINPAFVGEVFLGVDVDAIVGADEPVGACGGGQVNATVEEFVPDVVFWVVPKRIEEVEGVEFAESGGDGGFHATSVVTPDDNAALFAGFVATEA